MRLSDLFGNLEEKIRYVRTPEGARKYGQPIGTPIVLDSLGSVVPNAPTSVSTSPTKHATRNYDAYSRADRRKAERVFNVRPRELDANGKPKKGKDGKAIPPPPAPSKVPGAKHLWKWESDYEDYEAVISSDNIIAYIQKWDGQWGAWDSNNVELAIGSSRADVIKQLDDVLGPRLKPGFKFATESQRDRENFKKQFPDAGKVIAPAWRDVAITTDPNSKLIAYGYDDNGREQPIYTNSHRGEKDAEKFQRISVLNRQIPKIEKALKANIGDDTSDCLMMCQRLGMRPDSGGETGAIVETFGATSLQAKHVKVTSTGYVTLNFTPGKKKEPVTIRVKDPVLAQMLRARLEYKKGNQPLFDTSSGKIASYLKTITGLSDLKVKDLRTWKANALALQFIEEYDMPETKTEFKKFRNEIGDRVSEVLGNTRSMALGSYINPAAFNAWLSDPDWLK
jgi:DNA topoisomerase I